MTALLALLTMVVVCCGCVVQSNDGGDYFPLWGTCLGFEMLSYLAAGRNHSVISSMDAVNLSLPLKFTKGTYLIIYGYNIDFVFSVY